MAADETLIVLKLAYANFAALQDGVELEHAKLRLAEDGDSGIWLLHVEGRGKNPFPARGEGPDGEH